MSGSRRQDMRPRSRRPGESHVANRVARASRPTKADTLSPRPPRRKDGKALWMDHSISDGIPATPSLKNNHHAPGLDRSHSTVTLFARFLGLSTSQPRETAM